MSSNKIVEEVLANVRRKVDFYDVASDARRRTVARAADQKNILEQRNADESHAKVMARIGEKPVTYRVLWDKYFPAMGAVIDKRVAEQLDPLILELDQIRREFDALKTRPELKYLGIWKKGRSYSHGTFITHDLAIWHAQCNTSDEPGTSGDWLLALKSPVRKE